MKLPNASTITPLLFLLTASLLVVQGCGDNSTGFQNPPDFSTVPSPYDTTEAVSFEEQDNGLVIFTIEESNSPWPPVVSRDIVRAFYTGRTTDGEVFASTYANGNTNPSRFTNLTPTNIGQTSSLIEGFRLGIIGMKEGERRTLVIPPSLGYGESQRSELRNDTLVYDIKLVEIE